MASHFRSLTWRQVPLICETPWWVVVKFERWRRAEVVKTDVASGWRRSGRGRIRGWLGQAELGNFDDHGYMRLWVVKILGNGILWKLKASLYALDVVTFLDTCLQWLMSSMITWWDIWSLFYCRQCLYELLSYNQKKDIPRKLPLMIQHLTCMQKRDNLAIREQALAQEHKHILR